MTEYTLTVGQRVALNRCEIVVVEKVSPTGRATIEGGRVFNPKGRVRSTKRGDRDFIEPLTAENEAEMMLVSRATAAKRALVKAVAQAERWEREFGAGARYTWPPKAADVETAERLVAAINGVLGEPKWCEAA